MTDLRRTNEPVEELQSEVSARILTEADCERILQRAHAMARGGGDTSVTITSWWQGEIRWGRNRVTSSTDRQNHVVMVSRMMPNGVRGTAQTNQLDDESLEGAVRAAERISGFGSVVGRGVGYYPPLPSYERPTSAIWSDATYGLTDEARGEVARALIAPAEDKGMLSAGYLEVRAAARAVLSTAFPELRNGKHAFWEQPYIRWTQAQCSTTVRNPAGTASGWAGGSSYDWGRLDAPAFAERALQKCLAAQNPVSLEPGRYTVILEPQAVCDLLELLTRTFMREHPENGNPGPWRLVYDDALGLWRSKLGLKVADERVTISHDFTDPDLGIVASTVEEPRSVTWIERGILKSLGHLLKTDIQSLDGWHSRRYAVGYRMSGGDTSLEEMIQTTRRGLLVTRLSNLRGLDVESLLATGLTRDGLWLIEDGKITKAVNNFRFTESPLFVLNNIEQLGEPVRVFRPTRGEGEQLTPAVVPPIKVRDFSFTSLVGAV